MKKTRHFGKITAYDESHGFRDFRLSVIYYFPFSLLLSMYLTFRTFAAQYSLKAVSDIISYNSISIIYVNCQVCISYMDTWT